jgi:hypothetical protein
MQTEEEHRHSAGIDEIGLSIDVKTISATDTFDSLLVKNVKYVDDARGYQLQSKDSEANFELKNPFKSEFETSKFRRRTIFQSSKLSKVLL